MGEARVQVVGFEISRPNQQLLLCRDGQFCGDGQFTTDRLKFHRSCAVTIHSSLGLMYLNARVERVSTGKLFTSM